MIVLGHVAGIPIEELLPAAASVGTTLLMARVWLHQHLRRKQGPGP